MKTIHAEFTHPDGRRAAAVGRFEAENAEGPVTWTGDAALVAAMMPDAGRPPEILEGGLFARQMAWFAGRAGAAVEIREDGDWTLLEM